MDELNNMAINDGYQMASLYHLRPSTNVLSKTEANRLSGDFNLPKQSWVTLANWLEEGVEDIWQS